MPILLYDMSLIKGETHRQPMVVAELGEFEGIQKITQGYYKLMSFHRGELQSCIGTDEAIK